MLPTVRPIPEWDISGVLPASYEGDPVSPYEVSLLDVVVRFGDTEVRRRLLSGLLDFRAELHNAGLEQGFQWINGSFVENIEDIEGRSPRDIDVVTFCYIPGTHTQVSLFQENPDTFDKQRVQDTHHVDAYIVFLNQVSPERLISRSSYWNSLFSHDRLNLWKGYVQVDLASDRDTEARTELERLDGMGA